MKEEKVKLLTEFLDAQPPEKNGEDLLNLWEQLYDENAKTTVVKTPTGPSDDETNPVFPYEKIQAIINAIKDSDDNWKWPRMWQRFDEIERRGPAYREGEKTNFGLPNKNPDIVPQRVLVVGGGPVGMRMSIELMMGGHVVTQWEKRREKRSADGHLEALGFTNRINRPHMWPFVRNDLAKLNGKDFLSRAAAYPVFTEPETSSIGIDELQCLLMKNALLLGVDFRLGVGYVNAKVQIDEDSMMPTWMVEGNYDDHAAEFFKQSKGKNKEEFDCLVGCDGPRSAVRDTQAKFFGNIEKRKFMDCVGIVANVRKCNRKRLKELGFDYGQEPGDMNRTKMVFKDFFKKLEEEADADIENLIYYKAAFHNYTILVPKRADIIKHDLGAVYTFHEGRDGANKETQEKKQKLKDYCARVLKAAGIPIDPQAENGGFVGQPNDCMAFDFAECWNTKKSLAFNLPPPGYSVEEDGEWEGRKVNPFVCLAGDSLLEPFWPMGLGLKRGWQAIMDTNYAIDNLYNRLLLCERNGGDPEEWSWEQHYEALGEQCVANFEFCNRLQVAEDLARGEYEDKGLVMTQLKKMYKDAEKPPFEVEIDPWTRYGPLEKEQNDYVKKMPKEEAQKWIHPKVKKAIAVMEFYKDNSKGGKNGEIDYEGKELISVNGKMTGGFKQAGKRPSLGGGEKKKKGPAAAPTGARGKKGAGMGGLAAAVAAKAGGGAEPEAAPAAEPPQEIMTARAECEKLNKALGAINKKDAPETQEGALAEVQKMIESTGKLMDALREAETALKGK